MDWNTAKQTCTQEKIFRMATLEKLSTFTYVARLLEEWVNQQKVQETWYWLDATFNEKDKVCMWNGDPKRALTFSNFFYRYPRPTGIGSQVTWRNMYDIQSNMSQCLAIALPYPGLATPGSAIFGHSTTFDERPCVSSQKRHAICEYVSECGASSTDPFTLTEDATEAAVEFGFLNNDDATRSKYKVKFEPFASKQTLGSLICPKGFKMARHNSTRWYSSSKQTSGTAHIYDCLETYWVVDDERFNKDMHSQCAISEPEGDEKTRQTRKV
ncbi:unnamed protein product [Orchesella dallaii]|uniref:C-type lectin domain-containing protein n=1 Tax=Orchesella dallaii TaxID=48710 RepID=A0ABP1S454_9HEXA